MNTNLFFTPKIVRAGEGDCLELHGETRHQLLDGSRTGGALALARSEFQAGAGAPLHVHIREDEWFFVERGQFSFQIDKVSHTVGTGDFVFGPRNVPHGYTCESEDGGELLIGVVSAGFENFFAEISAQSENGAFPDLTQLKEMAAHYGVRFDGFEQVETPKSAPKIVSAGGGECVEAFGDRIRILVSSAESEGRFCVIEAETPSFMGPPPHLHERDDETFFILAGRYEFTLGDARVQAEAGDVIFAPRGVPHTFRVVSAQAGRLLVFATPGGFDVFFRECARLFESGHATPESIGQIAASHGVKFLLPES
ncbi:MAG TPA: cupin domain-containing protein [Abditibacterium sp.]|jgi:quercetin 2,3-dioxygenase